MNRTICQFKSVTSWILCALVLWLSPYVFGQLAFGQLALPPLYPVHTSNFTIPFEPGPRNTMREVELLVSRDHGRSWQFVARQPVETRQFAFRAEADGEYWFAFREVSMSRTPPPFNGQPLLRVLVNTTEPMTNAPVRESVSGPVTPPRPERVPIGTRLGARDATPATSQERSTSDNNAPENNAPENITRQHEGLAAPVSTNRVERAVPELPRPAFGPRLPGFDPEEARRNQGDLLEDLLSGMRPFMEVEPVVRRAVPRSPIASNAAPVLPSLSDDRVAGVIDAGVIDDVRLGIHPDVGPLMIVLWHTGHESWHDAQVHVLRGSSSEGPWIPIATNLPNNGEYWWFLTPGDLQPFYVAVQVRSLSGGVQMGISPSAITIDPAVAQFRR